ncbi:hypothetical protein RHSIM_Rhsim02G0046800 [Rhododendron simsii]|uniref:Uncharacterized protein n=1 Tax=Rhododendron simsii TaxID=118357 RepID=A0A834LV49_RHOSS|nr:hypothetical protein RHSIM_Rhsim02G0046800 [Rhododendron simsii]
MGRSNKPSRCDFLAQSSWVAAAGGVPKLIGTTVVGWLRSYMGAESPVSRWSFWGLRLHTGTLGGGLVCCRSVVSIRGWFIYAWGVGRRSGS